MEKKTPKIKAKITAHRDFIWVLPLHERKIGTLYVPDTVHDPENPEEGIVVAVGTGLVEGGVVVPLVVEVGDHIHFPRNSGTLRKIVETGETFFILRENQSFGSIDV